MQTIKCLKEIKLRGKREKIFKSISKCYLQSKESSDYRKT